MNAIIGTTELCLETDLNSEQREMLESIQESTGAVYRMMQTLIDITALRALQSISQTPKADSEAPRPH